MIFMTTQAAVAPSVRSPLFPALSLITGRLMGRRPPTATVCKWNGKEEYRNTICRGSLFVPYSDQARRSLWSSRPLYRGPPNTDSYSSVGDRNGTATSGGSHYPTNYRWRSFAMVPCATEARAGMTLQSQSSQEVVPASNEEVLRPKWWAQHLSLAIKAWRVYI